jgi:xylulokinase
MYLLGYDIGSSSIKVALVKTDTHETVDLVQYPETDFDIISRQSGWAEQQPELWWQDLCFATRKIIEKNNIKPTDKGHWH